jgi:hypothetical protein
MRSESDARGRIADMLEAIAGIESACRDSTRANARARGPGPLRPPNVRPPSFRLGLG